MRARYAAYALGKVRFVQDTTVEPRRDRDAWTEEIARFCAVVSFDGLIVGPVEPGGEPDEAHVTFTAVLRAEGVDVGFTERSRFVRRDRWLYADGVRLEPEEA